MTAEEQKVTTDTAMAILHATALAKIATDGATGYTSDFKVRPNRVDSLVIYLERLGFKVEKTSNDGTDFTLSISWK